MSMDEDLENMSRDALVAEAKRLRAGVRAHRDSSGHDLRWHHPQLWGLLPERTDPDVAVPSWPKFLRACVAYREALDRELSGAPVADVDYDAMEHIRTPGLEAFEGRWHFSHVVAARGLLLLSGVTATGVDGMVSSVPAEQFEQAFVHLRLYLEAAEASLEDVVEMTSYHAAAAPGCLHGGEGPPHRRAIPGLVGDRRLAAHHRGGIGRDPRHRCRSEIEWLRPHCWESSCETRVGAPVVFHGRWLAVA
jgi:enamine deaminase RidA (YjgF/YER057c/UK114 family)